MVNESGRADGNGFYWVNPHCLENIVRLSDGFEIRACHDIVDDAGTTLWPRGGIVSWDLHARIRLRRLRRPLEVSLDVEAGTTMETVLRDCQALMAHNPAVAALGSAAGTQAMLRMMRSQQLPAPVRLLLTSAREHKRHNYETSLAAMVVSAELGFACGLSEHDTAPLILSALVHDIGEMYINPEYLDPARQLQPDEWKHVVTHPCVGQAFLREFTNFPQAVMECVVHHHERPDGSGYPFQVPGRNLGMLDKLICVADTVAAIIMRSGPAIERRVLAALRMFSEEFPRPAVSCIARTLTEINDMSEATAPDQFAERIQKTTRLLRAVQREAESLLDAGHGRAVVQGCDQVIGLVDSIDAQLRAAGISHLSGFRSAEPGAAVREDIGMVLDETSWRLRHLARTIYHHAERHGDSRDLAALAGLVALLDQRPWPTQ